MLSRIKMVSCLLDPMVYIRERKVHGGRGRRVWETCIEREEAGRSMKSIGKMWHAHEKSRERAQCCGEEE